MDENSVGDAGFAIEVANEADLLRLVTDIANALEPGDVVTLSGDLGAGKTTLARALIRQLAGDPALEVPSPTFTLVQTYETPRFPVVHADFYRLAGAEELGELGFDDLPKGAVVLIEWPERAPDALSPDRFDIALALAPRRGAEHRDVRVTGCGSYASRARRIGLLRRFLDENGLAVAARERLAGDASTRSYERLMLGSGPRILMNAPRRPDGPPVKNGKPYSAIAHLAEDMTPFVAIANGLRARGFSAPRIEAADLEHGFAVIEDLGSAGIVSGDPPAPIPERYRAAVELLAALHGQSLPDTLPVSPQIAYRLPRYDEDAFLIEVELLLDWYLPILRAAATPAARSSYLAIWREALQPAFAAPATWVLRDYHSPNLLWLADRSDAARVGLLDFQDAVIGPAAYDVASLLQDARVEVPEALEIELISHYARVRMEAEPSFDLPGFARLYATLAAQRASKILGIFARLDRRDGKPQYLRHLPRVWGYLQRALKHPALAPLKAWYRLHAPPPPSRSA